MPGCAAYGCSNRSEHGFSLKVFPRDRERRAIWTSMVNRKNWTPTNSSYICEKHFDEDQWEVTRVDGKKKLKTNAIPTIFEISKTKYLSSRKIERKKGKFVKKVDDMKTCDISENVSMKRKNVVEPLECFVCCCSIASKHVITISSLTTTSGVTMKQRLIGISNIPVSKLESCNKNDMNSLCNRCARLINYVDRMEAELALLKGAISGCLQDKSLNGDTEQLIANMASHSLILDQFDSKLIGSSDDDSVSNGPVEKDPLSSDVEESISEDKDVAADIESSFNNNVLLLNKSLHKEDSAVLLKESLCKEDDVVFLKESLSKQGNVAVLKGSLHKDDDVVFLKENLRKEDDVLLKENLCKKDKVVLLKSSANCDSNVIKGREEITEEKRNYQCKICLIRTTSRSVLIFHLRKHMANYQWCDFCDVPLKSDDDNSSDEVQV